MINALFFGKPLCVLNKAIPPSVISSLVVEPSSKPLRFFFATINKSLINLRCAATKRSTLGFNSTNSCLSPFAVGPEIINGVLASSIKTESTSSTIVK